MQEAGARVSGNDTQSGGSLEGTSEQTNFPSCFLLPAPASCRIPCLKNPYDLFIKPLPHSYTSKRKFFL